MTTHPIATAPGGVLGLRLWTQPLEALATRGGVLAVGRYFRIKAKSLRIRLTISGKLRLASDKGIVLAIVDLRVQIADAIAQGGSRVKPPRAS